jgi:hypothetical protein
MKTPDHLNSLEIDRDDFTAALKAAASQVTGFSPGDLGLYFESGKLVIKADDTVAAVTASGTWPVPVFVPSEWVRTLEKHLPAGDPVCLNVEGGRIFVNGRSEACSLTESEDLRADELSEDDEEYLFCEAAALLKPLRVTYPDLVDLVTRKRPHSVLPISSRERQFFETLAKAWVLLAPFGVETADLLELADGAFPDAWR